MKNGIMMSKEAHPKNKFNLKTSQTQDIKDTLEMDLDFIAEELERLRPIIQVKK